MPLFCSLDQQRAYHQQQEETGDFTIGNYTTSISIIFTSSTTRSRDSKKMPLLLFREEEIAPH